MLPFWKFLWVLYWHGCLSFFNYGIIWIVWISLPFMTKTDIPFDCAFILTFGIFPPCCWYIGSFFWKFFCSVMSLEHRTARSLNLGLRGWIFFVPGSVSSVLLISLGCATTSWRRRGNHGCVVHLGAMINAFWHSHCTFFKAGQIMLNGGNI